MGLERTRAQSGWASWVLSGSLAWGYLRIISREVQNRWRTDWPSVRTEHWEAGRQVRQDARESWELVVNVPRKGCQFFCDL